MSARQITGLEINAGLGSNEQNNMITLEKIKILIAQYAIRAEGIAGKKCKEEEEEDEEEEKPTTLHEKMDLFVILS